jgi:hypothetical protein
MTTIYFLSLARGYSLSGLKYLVKSCLVDRRLLLLELKTAASFMIMVQMLSLRLQYMLRAMLLYVVEKNGKVIKQDMHSIRF